MSDCCAGGCDAGLVGRARRLGWLTIGYNTMEAGVGLTAGILAGSLALQAFSFDSVVEVAAGGIALWRLKDEARERLALKAIAVTFFLLAAVVAYEALEQLATGRPPQHTWVGIGLTAASLVIMPLLARAKRDVALKMRSATLLSESPRRRSARGSQPPYWWGCCSTAWSGGGGPTRSRRWSWCC